MGRGRLARRRRVGCGFARRSALRRLGGSASAPIGGSAGGFSAPRPRASVGRAVRPRRHRPGPRPTVRELQVVLFELEAGGVSTGNQGASCTRDRDAVLRVRLPFIRDAACMSHQKTGSAPAKEDVMVSFIRAAAAAGSLAAAALASSGAVGQTYYYYQPSHAQPYVRHHYSPTGIISSPTAMWIRASPASRRSSAGGSSRSTAMSSRSPMSTGAAGLPSGLQSQSLRPL